MYAKISSLYEERKWLIIYSLCAIALLYLVFAPAVNFLYYGGDDMRYSFGNPTLHCNRDDGYYFMMALGRPLQAWLDCQSFHYAYTVERMRYVRFIAVVLMGCGVGLLADWLRMYGVTMLQGFLIALALVLVPHLFGDTILMGALSLPVPIILSVMAYRCVVKARAYSALNSSENYIKSRRLLFMASGLLILAMLSYPAMTFFFCTLMLINALFSSISDWQKTKGQLMVEARVFLIAAALFFVWAYFNMHYNHYREIPRDYHLDKPNFNPIEMFDRLRVLVNVFDPDVWLILPMTSMAKQGYWLLVLIVGGAITGLVTFFMFGKREKLNNLFQAVVYLAALLMLSSAFSLLIPQANFGARLLMGTVSSGIALAIWGLFQWGKVFPAGIRSGLVSLALIAYLVVQMYEANLNTMRGALMFVTYLNRYEVAMNNYFANNKELKRIQFIIPKGEAPYIRFFHANVTLNAVKGQNQYPLKWCSASRDGHLSDMSQKEKVNGCLSNLKEGVVGVTYSYKDEPYFDTEAMMVIDNPLAAIDINKLVSA